MTKEEKGLPISERGNLGEENITYGWGRGGPAPVFVGQAVGMWC